MAESSSHNQFGMKGWLLKWTNYMKGYQPRWFVLSNGTLSYYRNQAEMAHTCRGTINLLGALIHTNDANTFVISNGTSQAFYLRASGEVERQRWVTALELAKTKAIKTSELLDETDFPYKQDQQFEVLDMIKILGNRIGNLQAYYNLIEKHGNKLKRTLSEIEKMETLEEIADEIKNVNHTATLFRITSGAMINNCMEYLELIKKKFYVLQHLLYDEQNKRKHLEEIVQQLIVQHSILNNATKEKCMLSNNEIQSLKSMNQTSIPFEDESTQFFDALENSSTSIFTSTNKNLSSLLESNDLMESTLTKGSDDLIEVKSNDEIKSDEILRNSYPTTSQINPNSMLRKLDFPKRDPIQRRIRIPDRPNAPLSLWSVLKNSIGKDLSKIPMPVNFSEPLSMLQRLAEEFEYSSVLDHAVSCKDVFEQLAYLAAFVISSYSTTAIRAAKPFNPLLGETYELDRTDDFGWRLISEKVSHHPPMTAQHCESKEWTFWQEFTMSSKFRGKYLQIIPLGIAHLVVQESGNHFTWKKVTTTVNNIIVGTVWVDQHGEMDIINHTDGSRCHLTFLPFSYFKTENQRRVKGIIYDKEDKIKWILDGTWDKEIKVAPVLRVKETKGSPVYDTGDFVTAWKLISPPPGSEKYYNMSVFGCQLNEREEGVAPTDSRHRPDQRLMEEGNWDEANIIKIALEEKQRATRKAREKAAKSGEISKPRMSDEKSVKTSIDTTDSGNECTDVKETEYNLYTSYEATWFKKEVDPITGHIIHIYDGTYWPAKEKRDWRKCPNIYL